jgi:MFS family permease
MSLNSDAFKRNIPLMYIIGSLMWARFFLPVLALFYIASQVSIEQFGIILGVFSLTICLLQIPTGVIADFFGRRNTLLLSRICYIAEVLILCFCNGFWPFLIAKVISGVGVSLSSGTNEALLYETLKKTNRISEHRKIFGNLQSISNVFMAIVFIIGAYLFTINPKLPAFVSIPFIFIGLVLTFFLKDPYKVKKNVSFKKTMKHFADGTRLFFSNKDFILITLFSTPSIFVFNIVTSLSSAYFQQVLIPVSLIGIVSSIGSLLYAYTAKKEHVLEDKIGSRNMIYLLVAANAISLLLMAFLFPYIGAFVYLIIPSMAGFGSVFINHYMNLRVSSAHRATMLSIRSMFDNFGVFVIFPVAGGLANISMTYSSIFLAALMLVFFGAFLIYKKKNKLLEI